MTDPADAAIARVLFAVDDRFTALVAAARLHPSRDLRGCNFSGISIGPEEDIAGYDFSGSTLCNATLCGVDLRRVCFADCDLSGADLRGTGFEASHHSGVRCDGARFGDWPERPEVLPSPVEPESTDAIIQAELMEAANDAHALYTRGREFLDETELAVAEVLLDTAAIIAADEDNDDADNLSLLARHYFGRTIIDAGRSADAETLFRTLIPICERVMGVEDEITLSSRYFLARAILDAGRVAEAEALFRALLPIDERVRGPEDRNTLATRHCWARAVLDSGRTIEAEQLFRSLLPIDERVSGIYHKDTQLTRLFLARCLLVQGQVDAADAIAKNLAIGPSWLPRQCALLHLLRAELAYVSGSRDAALSELDSASAQLTSFPPESYIFTVIAEARNRFVG